MCGRNGKVLRNAMVMANVFSCCFCVLSRLSSKAVDNG